MGCHCKLKMVDEHRKTAEMSPEEMGRLEDELKLACPKDQHRLCPLKKEIN